MILAKVVLYLGFKRLFMGKYERDWVEECEIAVSDSINGKKSDIYIDKISDSIVHKINLDYETPIQKSEWVGAKSYDDPGDIHVYLINQKKIPVELKFSFSTGSGTKANPTTNILKTKINQDIQSMVEFEAEKNIHEKRLDLVESVTGKRPVNNSQYVRSLRAIRNQEGTKGPGKKWLNNGITLDEISKITAPGQIEYASYVASKLNFYLKETQNWVDEILLGNNTAKATVIDSRVVYCVIKNFKQKNQTVEFYNFEEMDSTVSKVITSGKSIKIQNSSGKDILRISVTWKNICQGGQTPCFNIFIGNAYGA